MEQHTLGQELIAPWLTTGSTPGKRLYGERFTVVGKQQNAFTYFKTLRRFMNCAAHHHSSLLTPNS